jgi:hypothetical protein
MRSSIVVSGNVTFIMLMGVGRLLPIICQGKRRKVIKPVDKLYEFIIN